MAARDESSSHRTRRGRTTTTLDTKRGVFMISVAAELPEMHPQTPPIDEARGLITPQRSPRTTRLYSQQDVERLRRIQEMTAEHGLNLAGVETVLELEAQLDRARAELAKMRERTAELEQQMLDEMDRVRRSLRTEIVPYGAYETPAMTPPVEADAAQIPVERPQRARRPAGES